MTDETTPTEEATVATTAPAPAPEAAPEPAPELTPATAETASSDATPAQTPESTLHALVDDFHALLTRVEGLEHDIKAELATGLEALAAKLKAAI